MAPEITLCLGGGAARGFAHIGALRAITENNIAFHRIIGISMGSIVGAIFSIMPDVKFLEERMIQLVKSPAFASSVLGSWTRNLDESPRTFFKKAQKIYTSTTMLRKFFTASGVVDHEEVNNIIFPLLPPIRMSSTEIPFVTSAVNIKNGTLRIFQGEDSLRSSVIASASMPLIFPPREIKGEYFVDAGVTDKLGVETAQRIEAGKIIVIDVSDEKLAENLPRSAFDVMLKTEEISSWHRRDVQLATANISIQPIQGNYHWADYSAYAEFIEMGFEATRLRISDMKILTRQKRIFGIF